MQVIVHYLDDTVEKYDATMWGVISCGITIDLKSGETIIVSHLNTKKVVINAS
jgi:hypothetical protein